MVNGTPPSRAGGRIGWPTLHFLLVALAVGCGADDAPAPTTPPPPPEPPPVGPPPDTLDLPDDPEHFFLEIWELPGFVPIEYSLGRPPRYAVTVGADLFYEGPTIEIFPGPLLPNIQRARVSADHLAAIVEATAATGVSQVEDVEDIGQPTSGPFIADAPTFEILLRDRRGSHLLRVEALGSVAHTDPRVSAIRELLDRLDRASAESPAASYVGDRIQVYVSADAVPLDPSVLNARPWPLPDPPPGDDQDGFECREYGGPVAAGLLDIFREANHGTRWDHQGTLHQLLARSLLPREEACER